MVSSKKCHDVLELMALLIMKHNPLCPLIRWRHRCYFADFADLLLTNVNLLAETVHDKRGKLVK